MAGYTGNRPRGWKKFPLQDPAPCSTILTTNWDAKRAMLFQPTRYSLPRFMIVAFSVTHYKRKKTFSLRMSHFSILWIPYYNGTTFMGKVVIIIDS